MSQDAIAWQAIINGYMPYKDDGSTYYAFVSAAGAWYIMKIVTDGSDNVTTFARGTGNVAAAWTAKTSQTYEVFHGFY